MPTTFRNILQHSFKSTIKWLWNGLILYFLFDFSKPHTKYSIKTKKMKKSQATEEHVPQAADIVEDDTDVDIDKTSFVRWNLPLSPLITYQSHWRVCVDTELSWSLFTFTSISTDCTMYTGAAAVSADNCLISYCTLVHFALLLLYTFYFIGNYSMFIMIVVINNKMKWKMHLHRVSWISKIILECIKAYILIFIQGYFRSDDV